MAARRYVGLRREGQTASVARARRRGGQQSGNKEYQRMAVKNASVASGQQGSANRD